MYSDFKNVPSQAPKPSDLGQSHSPLISPTSVILRRSGAAPKNLALAQGRDSSRPTGAQNDIERNSKENAIALLSDLGSPDLSSRSPDLRSATCNLQRGTWNALGLSASGRSLRRWTLRQGPWSFGPGTKGSGQALDVGLWTLIALLPFHLLLKRLLPHPIGTYWKEALLGLLLLIWLADSFLERRILLPRATLNLPVLFFFSFLFFRFFLGLWTSDPSGLSPSGRSLGLRPSNLEPGTWNLGLFGLYMLTKYIPLYFVALYIIRGRRQLTRYIGAMLLVGVICALGATLEFILDRHFLLSEDIRRIYGSYDLYIYATKVRRVYFTFDFPGALGSYLGLLLPLVVALIPVGRSARQKALLGGAGVALAAGLAVTFSRGPWLGLAAALIFMAAVALFERDVRRFLYIGLVSAILTLLFLAIGAATQARAPAGMDNVAIAQFLSAGEWGEATNVGRVEAWRRSIEAFKAYPLLGIGLGRTGATSLRFLPPGEGFVTESQVLKIAVETGLVGLLAFLTVWLFAFGIGLRAYTRLEEPASRALLLGLMAALVGVFVHGLGYQVLELKQTDMAVWLFMALISWLDRSA